MTEYDVLIVEDEADLREIFAEVLGEENLSVLQASNGQEAVDLLKSGARPSIALCDISMPIMDGLNFVREALIIQPTLGIVMLTAYEENDKILDALRLGAIDYLVKPVKLQVLVQRTFGSLRVANLKSGRGMPPQSREYVTQQETLMRVKNAGTRRR